MSDEDRYFDYTVDYWQKLKETCGICRNRVQEGIKSNENEENSCLQFEYLKERLST